MIGHVGLAILIWFIFEKLTGYKNDFYKLLIAIGSMLPDFLDKPIGAIFFNSGRWLGHSLFFQLAFLSLLLIIDYLKLDSKYRTEVVILYFGSLIHILGDLPSILVREVLLWPFYGPFPVHDQNAFLFGFDNPITVIGEIIGLVITIGIGVSEKWPKKYWKLYFIVIVTYSSLYLLVYALLVGW